MKKLIVLLFVGLLLAGCSPEFYKHDSVYKNWDHIKFSWWGYKNPTAADAKMSDQEGWWGEEIPYIPAEQCKREIKRSKAGKKLFSFC